MYSVLGFYYSEECGVMIAIALFDMHECGEKRREVKRFKYIASGNVINISKPIGSFEDEPRSPFVFFLYSNQRLLLCFLIQLCSISTQFLGLIRWILILRSKKGTGDVNL